MRIKYTVKGLDAVKKFVASLPRPLKILAMKSASEYLVGDKSHGLKHEPSYRFVTRKAAYGESFSSDKQRRWFFANLADGSIHPGQDNRTHAISNGWKVVSKNSDWNRVTIENKVPGIEFVMGDKQARQPAKAGWRYYLDTMEKNTAGAIRAAQKAVDKFIKSKS